MRDGARRMGRRAEDKEEDEERERERETESDVAVGWSPGPVHKLLCRPPRLFFAFFLESWEARQYGASRLPKIFLIPETRAAFFL